MVTLDTNRLRKAESIFDSVVGLPPESRRSALEQQCGPDGELRAFVERLIECDARRGSSEFDHRIFRAPIEIPVPQWIGRYRIIRTLGEGGMGVVFEAEQDHPRRRVALKMLRPGIILPRSIERFEREAEMLGRLKHPGIAQIIEAGAIEAPGPAGITATQPFFAMELVEGPTLIEYARLHNLPLRDRLELLTQVCDAVHYAHQRGVIHRDLKPDNILINDQRQPKILDFGVARAVEVDQAARPQATLAGQLVGTIPYMSPEQLGGRSDAVDTRSDVYSLGVFAFELLTGTLPFDLAHANGVEAIRIIEAAEIRRAGVLKPELCGDVDAILVRALEFDIDRRYGSCAEFSEDIRRFLRHEVVRARPPTFSYRLAKFTRRNRGLVAGVTLAILTLIAGSIGTATYAFREARQIERVQAQAARAESILRLMREMLASADPRLRGTIDGGNITVREVLDVAAQRIQSGELAGQPEAEIALWTTICETYVSLGCYAEARSHLEKALARIPAAGATLNEETIALNNLLGRALEGLSLFSEAEQRHRAAVDSAERMYGPDDLRVAKLLNDLGVCWRRAGRLEQAEVIHRRALANREQAHATPLEVAESLAQLGEDLHELSRLNDAEPLLRRALQIRREHLPPAHPTLSATLNQLANLLRRLEKYEEAESLMGTALQMYRQRLDPGHPDLANALNDMAMIVKRRGRAADAEKLVREALEIQLERFGQTHRDVAATRLNLAFLLDELERVEDAEREARLAMDVMRKTFGSRHQEFAFALHNVALIRSRRGNPTEAEPLLREATEIIDYCLGKRHEVAAHMRDSLAVVLIRLDKNEEAVKLLDEAVATRRDNLGPKHTKVALSMAHLATAKLRNGDPAGAIADVTEALPILSSDPAGPADVGAAQLVLAEARLILGQPFEHGEVERLILDTLQQFTDRFGRETPQTTEALRVHGLYLIHAGQFDEAERVLRETLEIVDSLKVEAPFRSIARKRIVDTLNRLPHQRGQQLTSPAPNPD